MKILIKNKKSMNNYLIKNIRIEDFDEIYNSDKIYVIKFMSPACHLCVALTPYYHKIVEEFSDKCNFGVVNTLQQRKLSSIFKLDGVPQFYIAKNKKLKEIPYPENPDPTTGYSYSYLREYILQELQDENG